MLLFGFAAPGRGSAARSSPGPCDARYAALPLEGGQRRRLGRWRGSGRRKPRSPGKSSQTSMAAPPISAIRIPARRRSGRSPPVLGDGLAARSGGRRPAGRARPRRRPRGRGRRAARRQEVGNVEAAHAALHARDPLLEQDALDQLGLGEVVGAGDADLVAARVLRLDLAGALVGLGDRLLLVAPHIDERHLAIGAEALAERVLARTAGAGEGSDLGAHGLHRSAENLLHKSSTSSTRPSRIANPRTLGSSGPRAADQIQRIGPVLGQVDVGLGGLGRALRVRVVDRRDLLPAPLDLGHDPELVGGVDRVSKRARLGVAGRGGRGSPRRRPRRPSRSTRSAPPLGRGRRSPRAASGRIRIARLRLATRGAGPNTAPTHGAGAAIDASGP